MNCFVPVPPLALSPIPSLERLPANAELHRIHAWCSNGAEFEACRVSRFAPMTDAAGHCIPVLYAAGTFEDAVHESLFHAITPNQEVPIWPASGLVAIAHSTLETRRDLDLVPLSSRTLIGWNVPDLAIVKAPARYYRRTARWAEAVHRSIAGADGIAWTPNREGSGRCYAFFGDRVKEADFAVSSTRQGHEACTGSDMRRAALQGGVWLSYL